MKELILWKEVDVKDELPDDENEHLIKCYDGIICKMNLKDNEWFLIGSDDEPCYYTEEVTHWLKRVVIPILSDQEIGTNHFSDCEAVGSWVNTESKCNCKERKEAYLSGYKAMQERFLGGEGL